MKKHIIVLVILCFFILGLVGCDESNSSDEKLKILNVKLTNEEYAFAVSKSNTALRDDINKFITEIKNNGSFDAIVSIYKDKRNYPSLTGYNLANGPVENTDKNLVVVTNCPFEPFEFLGQDGKIYGIDIEIAQAYASAKGLELVIRNIEFDNIIDEVVAGKADLGMAGITVTVDRLMKCNFTEHYYSSSQVMIVDGNNHDFDNCKKDEDVRSVIKSLSDERYFGYQIGTTGNNYVTGLGTKSSKGIIRDNIKAMGFKTAREAINAMNEGKLYAVILDEATAASMLSEINFQAKQKNATSN